ncbi:uncharacterized protein LOC125029881 [Penaeus chinensis]|uniref:uncharacterized protein LOC125029881 n=1 Tax=Penaeus chinensis TaxID=139456 RepID=UPI001FB5B0A7|nr:uncharacterized protein LOC125029881 [Penaeus chinensis]
MAPLIVAAYLSVVIVAMFYTYQRDALYLFAVVLCSISQCYMAMWNVQFCFYLNIIQQSYTTTLASLPELACADNDALGSYADLISRLRQLVEQFNKVFAIFVLLRCFVFLCKLVVLLYLMCISEWNLLQVLVIGSAAEEVTQLLVACTMADALQEKHSALVERVWTDYAKPGIARHGRRKLQSLASCLHAHPSRVQCGRVAVLGQRMLLEMIGIVITYIVVVYQYSPSK